MNIIKKIIHDFRIFLMRRRKDLKPGDIIKCGDQKYLVFQVKDNDPDGGSLIKP